MEWVTGKVRRMQSGRGGSWTYVCLSLDAMSTPYHLQASDPAAAITCREAAALPPEPVAHLAQALEKLKEGTP